MGEQQGKTDKEELNKNKYKEREDEKMKQVQYGMVGGDLKALIGEVHRKGLAFDPRAELVCG